MDGDTAMRKTLVYLERHFAQGVSRSQKCICTAHTSPTPVVVSVQKLEKKLNPKYSMAKLRTGWYRLVHTTVYNII